tara:strand:- start:5728 stop:6768 length:1041 start_codon:yes stop_codon:yes gene_type:complete
MMANNKDIYSRHAHYLEQYYNGQADRFIPFLNKAMKKIKAELLKTNTVNNANRQKAKLDLIEEIIQEHYGEFTVEIQEELALFANSEAEFAVGALESEGVYNTKLPSASQTAAAINARPFNGVILKDYFKNFPKQQAKAIRNTISTGFFEGNTTQQIVSEVLGTKSSGYTDGFVNISRTSADRMVRTSLNHTSATAKEKVFEDNDDLIPYYEWVSTLDSRTSHLCQSRDGNVYKVGKGPLPPAHYNCRSTTSPVFDEDVKLVKGELTKIDQGGLRSSLDGNVSGDINYNDWLKRQNKSFQIDALGTKRAELFRKGGLTVDKFVNDKGKTLTLEQLKTKYPTAWGKI